MKTQSVLREKSHSYFNRCTCCIPPTTQLKAGKRSMGAKFEILIGDINVDSRKDVIYVNADAQNTVYVSLATDSCQYIELYRMT